MPLISHYSLWPVSFLRFLLLWWIVNNMVFVHILLCARWHGVRARPLFIPEEQTQTGQITTHGRNRIGQNTRIGQNRTQSHGQNGPHHTHTWLHKESLKRRRWSCPILFCLWCSQPVPSVWMVLFCACDCFRLCLILFCLWCSVLSVWIFLFCPCDCVLFCSVLFCLILFCPWCPVLRARARVNGSVRVIVSCSVRGALFWPWCSVLVCCSTVGNLSAGACGAMTLYFSVFYHF